MALQSSGAISLANLQGEYGGSNPISLSEYYRNGPYVPNSITTGTIVREPSSGEYGTLYNGDYAWLEQYGTIMINWATVQVYNAASTATSITVGSYTYYRGTYLGDVTDAKGMFLFSQYAIYRTSGSSTTIYVNQNVPTSGTISLSQFYGGRKT